MEFSQEAGSPAAGAAGSAGSQPALLPGRWCEWCESARAQELSHRSQRLDPLRAGDGDHVFEDLFDEDDAKEADNGSFRQSREPRRMEIDEDQPEIGEFDPSDWDDLEEDDDGEEEEELPETEEETWTKDIG
eukprot:s2664_g2.t1